MIVEEIRWAGGFFGGAEKKIEVNLQGNKIKYKMEQGRQKK